MSEEEGRRLLTALLEESRVPWERYGEWTRFRFRTGGMVWETACRCRKGETLVYSRCPMAARDRLQALAVCGRINSVLTRGAVFLSGSAPTFRLRADLSDVYGARDRLAEALEYSAAVLVRFWGELQAVCAADPPAAYQ